MYLARKATWATSTNTSQFEGNGEPPKILGVKGDRYWDLINDMWWVKRSVGFLNGGDYITIPNKLTVDAVSSIEMRFKTGPNFTSQGNSDLFGNELVFKIRSTMGRVQLLVGNATAAFWVLAGVQCTPVLNNSTWYKIRVDVNMPEKTVKVYLDDVLTHTATNQTISTTKSGFRFGTIDMIPTGTLIYNCKYNDIVLPIFEGSGTQLSDGYGRELGSLVDVSPISFWATEWIPLDLSYPII
jgi:hypothetical protein